MERAMRTCLALATLALLAAAGGCGRFIRPDAAVDYYVQGQLLAEQGDYAAALRELTRAIVADPNLSSAHEAIGDLHRRRGDYELARRAYQAACRTNPYAFRPHYNLGVTCQALAAAAHVAQTIEDYLRQAVQVYLRAVTLKPDDYEANLNLSACYFELGKYKLAEQYCRAAIECRPDSAAAYSNLGIIYDSQNRLWDAVSAYKTSLELDPRQPEILLNLAATYVRQNRLQAALGSYRLATKLAPDRADPWERMGACHFRMGQIDQARRCYEKAVALDGDHAWAHRGLGAAYMAAYLKDREAAGEEMRAKALEHWHRSLELDPQQPELTRLVRKYAPQYTAPQL